MDSAPEVYTADEASPRARERSMGGRVEQGSEENPLPVGPRTPWIAAGTLDGYYRKAVRAGDRAVQVVDARGEDGFSSAPHRVPGLWWSGLSLVRRAWATGLSPLSWAKRQRGAGREGVPGRGTAPQSWAEDPQPSTQSVRPSRQEEMTLRSNSQRTMMLRREYGQLTLPPEDSL